MYFEDFWWPERSPAAAAPPAASMATSWRSFSWPNKKKKKRLGKEEKKGKKERRKKKRNWANVFLLMGQELILVGFWEWVLFFFLGFGWVRRSEPMHCFCWAWVIKRWASLLVWLGLSAGLRHFSTQRNKMIARWPFLAQIRNRNLHFSPWSLE